MLSAVTIEYHVHCSVCTLQLTQIPPEFLMSFMMTSMWNDFENQWHHVLPGFSKRNHNCCSVEGLTGQTLRG